MPTAGELMLARSVAGGCALGSWRAAGGPSPPGTAASAAGGTASACQCIPLLQYAEQQLPAVNAAGTCTSARPDMDCSSYRTHSVSGSRASSPHSGAQLLLAAQLLLSAGQRESGLHILQVRRLADARVLVTCVCGLHGSEWRCTYQPLHCFAPCKAGTAHGLNHSAAPAVGPFTAAPHVCLPPALPRLMYHHSVALLPAIAASRDMQFPWQKREP